jgi:hypothetical protein
MLNVLAVTLPFFTLVLCGYLAVRRHVLPQLAIPGLNSFVLYFALPCMLYRFGASTPLPRLLDGAVFAVYLACAALTVALALAVSLRRAGWNNASFGALVAAFPNTGFMGLPLLLALLGPRSSGPVIVTMAIDLIVTTSACVALSRLQAGGQAARSSLAALRNALAGMLRNPMPWSILLGGLASAFAFELPGPAGQTVKLLADAASPVALFTIGAVLARSQMQAGASAAGKPMSAWGADVAAVALIKLLVHPALMWGIGTLAIALGLGLDRGVLAVLVLVACLPSASNVAMLAERFGADTGRVARIILLSTSLSFLSFSAAVALLA